MAPSKDDGPPVDDVRAAHTAWLLDERPRGDERAARLKELLIGDSPHRFLAELRAAIRLPQPPNVLRKMAALTRKFPRTSMVWRRTVRIAIVSSGNVADLPVLLSMYLLVEGIGADLYVGALGQIEAECLDPSSGLHAFGPELVILAPNHRDLRPEDDDLAHCMLLWRALQARHACRIVQFGFEVPASSPYGNLDLSFGRATGHRVRQLNLALALASSASIAILDVEALAASVGKSRWHDPRLWFLAKEDVAAEGRPTLALACAALIRGALGLAKRVIAVDLDNTLWGGVVGEDGVAALEISGTPSGEAFQHFQRHLKLLRDRGVLLAAVTRNNPHDAALPFREHPEMLLKLEDFAAFHAGWGPKSEALVKISRELDLSLDSFVFVDDNPGERAEVRLQLPEVEVLPISREASYFVPELERHRWFDSPEVTDADLRRAGDYAVRTAQARCLADSGSFDAFLQGLALEGRIGAFDEPNSSRIAQLVQRSNQFNLTTIRYTPDELRSLMTLPDVFTRYFRLKDSSTDWGLISIVVCRLVGDALDVESWLMSCRTLNRTVEHAFLVHLHGLARSLGAARITGIYLPTAKNALVAEHYARLGFTIQPGTEDGTTRWERRLELPLPPSAVAITDLTAESVERRAPDAPSP